MDVLNKSQRHKCMSSIQGKNTKPELLLRKALWRQGIRYRLYTGLPGKPDMIFPKAQLVVFIDGCFWHGCAEHFQQPKRNKRFWQKKIKRNIKRDREVEKQLLAEGWRVLRFWEHEIERQLDICVDIVIDHVTNWNITKKHNHSS